MRIIEQKLSCKWKSGKGNPNESRVELEMNLQAKHSALLTEDDNISNWLQRGRMDGITFI